MSCLRRMTVVVLLFLAFAVPVLSQTVKDGDDGTVLRQIIVFGRHSIRSSTVSPSTLAQFTTNTYPTFTGVPTGYLTPNGQEAARLLGTYFHDYLVHEGLLTGDASVDLSHSYFRANSIQRSNVTAAKWGEGLIPGATIPVHSFRIADPGTGAAQEPDPVFDPVAAKVVTVDPERALAEARGIYGDGTALTSSYSGELALIRGVLAPLGPVDPTSVPFTLSAVNPVTSAGGAILPGGLFLMTRATDPFVMQYADGFPLDDVGWGRLSPDGLSQQTRLAILEINIAMRLPYLSRVQSSNAASHVLRSLEQGVTGGHVAGAFGDPTSRLVVVISSDYYVAGLAGLLGVHWTLEGYQPDFCAPGGALVFELRQSKKTKKHLIRTYYTAQTFDQLRNLRELPLDNPPATMQLLIPGGSESATNLDVDYKTFKKLLKKVIDPQSVQNPAEEVEPPVLTDVPLN